MRTLTAITAFVVVSTAGQLAAVPTPVQQTQQLRRPDVIFVPTQDITVEGMLDLAEVGPNDVVYDLGCGDGKIVIAAARRGARAIGIDIDPQRVKEATANVKAAGLEDKVTIIHGDLFDPELKISDATVVTLYLLQSLNEKLKPRLQKELRPGTRIVSNTFTMGEDWPHEKMVQPGYQPVYLWTIK
ncbi:MAG TPA: methyltransferase domain-containing protein [Vicinamibacterales bacterium]|nr:methyltransferase domain-containing protein [Vicinamibacterales bacterium]